VENPLAGDIGDGTSFVQRMLPKEGEALIDIQGTVALTIDVSVEYVSAAKSINSYIFE